MSVSNVIDLPPSLTNLRQYVCAVERYPRLDAVQEREFAERLHEDNDTDAAWQLVTSHLRYVVYIARGYMGYGLAQEDLIQEGNVGLMKAVRRYDPGRGVRLAAYAAYWIRAHIHDFVLKNWRMVKAATTKAKRKLFYKLRGAKQRLQWLSQHEAEDIAETLGVGADDVIDMEAQLYLSDAPFDAPDGTDDDWAPAAFLADSRNAPEQVVEQRELADLASEYLREALGTLDDRSRDILERRWLAEEEDKKTLQELGADYGISAERVRQIEVAAIRRLRERIAPRLC